MTTVDRHAGKVARIVGQLRAHRGTKPVSLRKTGVSHQVPKAGDLRHRDEKIDISDLTEIIEIDPVRRICVAESGVTFVDLVTATLKHGLVPIVVPELKTITIGGAVAGCSIESMSFVHGGFHDTCLEYEVITATGAVFTCAPGNQHRLVFQMLHGTFGTLGILAKLTFRLIPAQPFVKLVYETHSTLATYQASIMRHAEARDIDFMDGIIHSPTKYVLSLGTFVEHAPYTSDYTWLWVYYESTRKRTEDYLTTAEYFFRYDHGVTHPRPHSFLGRLLFGKFLASTQWLALARKLHWLLPKEHPPLTVDVFVPVSKAAEFLGWWQREFGFYPLWCVPYKRVRDYEWVAPEWYARFDDTMFLDLAIYGMRQPRDRNVARALEEKLLELGGIKTLISYNYYSPDEFWSVWNKPNYDAVKAITDPQNLFRDLYTLMCRAAMGVT